jgi:hypothetical protein
LGPLRHLLEQLAGQLLQEGGAAAQAFEQGHRAQATQALLAGSPHGLLQRQASAVHQQQPQQRLGVADLSGPAQAAALAGDGVQIRLKKPCGSPPRIP